MEIEGLAAEMFNSWNGFGGMEMNCSDFLQFKDSIQLIDKNTFIIYNFLRYDTHYASSMVLLFPALWKDFNIRTLRELVYAASGDLSLIVRLIRFFGHAFGIDLLEFYLERSNAQNENLRSIVRERFSANSSFMVRTKDSQRFYNQLPLGGDFIDEVRSQLLDEGILPVRTVS